MSSSILSAAIADQCLTVRQHADALAEALAALADMHNGADGSPLFRCGDDTAAQVVAALQRIDDAFNRLDPLMISR